MKTLVVAPHPDDEVLGAGGTLLRRRAAGLPTAWLIVTAMSQDDGWSAAAIARRDAEIAEVTQLFGFAEVFQLRLPTSRLETLPMADLVARIAAPVRSFAPDEVLLPHLGDVHTDHALVHAAVVSATKSFRMPFVKRLLAYETISETDFGLDASRQFQPTVFVDISAFLDEKLRAMEIYASEMAAFPFPRSRTAIESLARYRGAMAGFAAAEAFQLLRSRE